MKKILLFLLLSPVFAIAQNPKTYKDYKEFYKAYVTTVPADGDSSNLVITSAYLKRNAGSGGGTSYTFTSPLVNTSGTVTINNAAADGSTKGAASFTAADFNSSSGLISLDYTNMQKASTSLPGLIDGSAGQVIGANKEFSGSLVIMDVAAQVKGTLTLGDGTATNQHPMLYPAGGVCEFLGKQVSTSKLAFGFGQTQYGSDRSIYFIDRASSNTLRGGLNESGEWFFGAPSSSNYAAKFAHVSSGQGITVNTSGQVFLGNVPAGTSLDSITGMEAGKVTVVNLQGGEYTPTIASTTSTNVASSTSGIVQYMRDGDRMHVEGSIGVTATTTLLFTSISVTLPVASAMTLATDLSGVASCQTASAVTAGFVSADTGNDVALVNFYPNGTSTTVYFSFTYKVK